ncbi:kinase-like protein [Sanghuangporus baumii]|uniref:Kinase-like protein n=1 Tax=Sanghuangporus baumii TaxID=108892 RepID=A0A9Q5I4S8_SANBA|nr:kinase-like protein [Sanghuangporus baumii]
MPSSPAPGSRKFIGAVHDEWRMFSDNPDDYEIGPAIGFGATSIVYTAHYIAKDGSPPYPCAVKVVNLDKLPQQSLHLLHRETQLMSLSKHPNVLRVRGSWMTGHNLYIALRLMNAGSAADVMHYGWPGGMEEEVVKCILKQALEGLNYLHINEFIHRDVKAANLLIDDDGTVLLGDLGVAASLSDEESFSSPSGSGQRMAFVGPSIGDSVRPSGQVPTKVKLGKRKSFVGTPCWMAPELISGKQYDAKADIWSFGITAIELTQGRAPRSREAPARVLLKTCPCWMAPELISGKQYDAKADIWSFGITAIELTQGRAPRSREAPARVLLKTVQDAPPEFSRESGQFKFSKAFKEIVESCLLKDPARRPSAAELLETSFFKSAKRKHYLVNTILKDLPPLIHRQERRAKSTALTGPTRSSISSWDFSINLVHTPDGHSRSQHNSVHPSYFNTVHSHHSQHHHHSHHTTIALPSPTRLRALEENAFADAFGRAKITRRQLASTDYDDEDADADEEHEDNSHSSVESSVFDEEEGGEGSHPTTPEIAASPMKGSSVAPTPLSSSPAVALDVPVQLGNPITPLALNSLAQASPTPRSTPSGTLLSKTKSDDQPESNSRQKNSKLQHPPLSRRRGSSPTSTTADRENMGTLPALKRIASTSGWSSPKVSFNSTQESSKTASKSTKQAPKESRWRKLMRGSGVGERTDESSPSPPPPALLKEGEKRKSALGRILERSGK